jgi:hypothetical protein
MPGVFSAGIQDLPVEESVHRDLTFHPVWLDVTVRNEAGDPVAGVPVRAVQVAGGPPVAMEVAPGLDAHVSSDDQRTTGPDGKVRMWAFPQPSIALHAEPAPGTGYGVVRTTVSAQGNQEITVVLPSASSKVTGTVRLANGAPVGAGVQVHLGGRSVTTGADGSYEISAPPGTYFMGVSGTWPNQNGLPDDFSLGAWEVTLAEDEVLERDLTIDPVVLDVSVQTSEGDPVSGAWLNTNLVRVATEVSGEPVTGDVLDHATTDGSGHATISVFPLAEDSPDLRLEVVPNAWSNLGSASIQGLRPTGDGTLTVVLSTFAGVLSDDGAGLAGQTVSLVPSSPGSGRSSAASTISTTTGTGGSFALTAPKAVYRLGVSAADGDGEAVPSSYDVEVPGFDLRQPREQDLSLPVVKLVVTARTAGGYPIPEARVSVPCGPTSFTMFSGGSAAGQVCGEGVTDGAGVAVVALLPMASFSVQVTPPSASGLAGTTLTNQSISADTARQVTLTAAGPVRRLSVTKTGLGSGTVTSTPDGIECGDACSATFSKGRLVTLTVAPGAFSSFTGWSGACSGTSRTCTVTMSVARTVGATFARVPSFLLTVNRTGSGSVTSAPVGIACPSDCVQRYRKAAVVVLTAKPATGWRLVKWLGGCQNPTAATCSVTMSGPQTRTAIFKPA